MIHQTIIYIPTDSQAQLKSLLEFYNFNLKIVNTRKTKRGDFRPTTPLPTITINNNLSKEQFLITLVHEIAHLDVFLNHKNVKPHGIEWKMTFQKLMLPFLTNKIFPEEILKPLARYLINPKATSDSDINLSTALLKNSNKVIDKTFIFELDHNTIFNLNGREFKILNKRRTRYECIEINTQKHYLIRANAPVTVVKNKTYD
ncbi:SprT-like domain-containing protein [Flavobacteriaceae bacterium]|nr:SprT-like domain-containing protein [Flavobacteriaceae bacterium]